MNLVARHVKPSTEITNYVSCSLFFPRCSLILFFRHPLWKSRQPDVCERSLSALLSLRKWEKERFSNALSAAEMENALSARSPPFNPPLRLMTGSFPRKSPPLAPLEKENSSLLQKVEDHFSCTPDELASDCLARGKRSWKSWSWQCVYF